MSGREVTQIWLKAIWPLHDPNHECMLANLDMVLHQIHCRYASVATLH